MTGCGICNGDEARKAWINAQLVKKVPHTKIEALSRPLGFNVKRETLRRHVNTCVPNAVSEASSAGRLMAQSRWEKTPTHSKAITLREPGVQARPPAPPPPPPVPLTGLPDTDDFATLVRHAAAEKLAAGELRITTQDGLQAQALLDKREEKKKDRELYVSIGRMLGGQGGPAPVIIDVTPMPSHGDDSEEEALLLAP